VEEVTARGGAGRDGPMVPSAANANERVESSRASPGKQRPEAVNREREVSAAAAKPLFKQIRIGTRAPNDFTAMRRVRPGR
jgi:hypothetical protein